MLSHDGHTGIAPPPLVLLFQQREPQVEHNWTQRHALEAWLTSTVDPEEGQIETSMPDISLGAHKASKKGNNPDLPNCTDAMEGEHAEEFKVAMKKEIDTLEQHATWNGVLKSDIPKTVK